MFFADVAQALRGIRRVLKPGGHAALLVWGPEHEQARYTSTSSCARRAGPRC
jgi:ubiquinone/menaquinone biosynthesis C-methylase UbiE